MSTYRHPAPAPTDGLSFDYAAELDRQRAGVGRNSVRGLLALVAVFGLTPFVALFGGVGIFIGLAMYAFIAIPVAIRRAQTSPADQIRAYEEKLLRKRSR